jgi:hypothetical protein
MVVAGMRARHRPRKEDHERCRKEQPYGGKCLHKSFVRSYRIDMLREGRGVNPLPGFFLVYHHPQRHSNHHQIFGKRYKA